MTVKIQSRKDIGVEFKVDYVNNVTDGIFHTKDVYFLELDNEVKIFEKSDYRIVLE